MIQGYHLSNEWNQVKSEGQPGKSWLAQFDSLKKELYLQDKVLDVKQFNKPLIKRICGV